MKKYLKKLLTITSITVLMAASVLIAHADWEYDNVGWWYSKTEAPGYASGWNQIDGKWYLFSENGYLLTGWQKSGGSWYYLNSTGEMAHDRWVGNYYLTSSGIMATNQWVGEYYVGNDGIWIPDYQKISVQEEDKQTIQYVLNISTKKFHYPSCSSVDAIKPENYQASFSSRENIIANGYVPCKKCNP